MKNALLVLNVILLLGLAYLYYYYFSSKSCNSVGNDGVAKGSCVAAYIDTDTLSAKYQLAIDLNAELTDKQENIRTDLNIKRRKIQQMVETFQRKINNNGFASRSRAESEQQKILDAQDDFQQLQEKLSAELFDEQQVMLERMGDTISNFLHEYNVDKGYSLIFRTTKNGNILHGDEALNITDDVVSKLNERYSPTEEIVSESEK